MAIHPGLSVLHIDQFVGSSPAFLGLIVDPEWESPSLVAICYICFVTWCSIMVENVQIVTRKSKLNK